MVVSFEAREGCIEHFPARHENDVDACGQLALSEQFSREPLGAISHDGRADLTSCRYSKPRGDPPVRHNEQRHELAMDPDALFVGSLELRAATNAFVSRQPQVYQWTTLSVRR